jgi:hypothetical protein
MHHSLQILEQIACVSAHFSYDSVMKISPEGVLNFDGIHDKDDFLQYATDLAVLLQGEDYRALMEGSDSLDTIAWLSYSLPEDSLGVQDIEININEEKLSQGPWPPEEVMNLIAILIRHEAAELWYLLGPEGESTSMRDANGRGIAHQKALLDEWRLAFELGCEDTYMECIVQWADDIHSEQGEEAGRAFLDENIHARQAIAEEFGVAIA